MSLNRYKLSHRDLAWEAEVEVDTEKSAPVIKEMVEFWLGWESRLEGHSGDYLSTFLAMLARELLIVVMEGGWGSRVSKFKNREGWYPLDGSQGITLVRCDDYRFEDEEFTVEPIVA